MTIRREKIFHFVAFVALVANLFAPVFTLPVTAEDLTGSDPTITTQETDTTITDDSDGSGGDALPGGEGGGNGNTGSSVGGDTGNNPPAGNGGAGPGDGNAGGNGNDGSGGSSVGGDNSNNPPAGNGGAGPNDGQGSDSDTSGTGGSSVGGDNGNNPPAGDGGSGPNDGQGSDGDTSGTGGSSVGGDNGNNPPAGDGGSGPNDGQGSDGETGDTNGSNAGDGNDPAAGNGETGEEDGDVSGPVEKLTLTVPAAPAVEGCGDALSVVPASGPAGINYAIAENADGSYTVTATVDPSMTDTIAISVEGTEWTPVGDGATLVVDPVACLTMGTTGHNGDEIENIKICHATGSDGKYTSNTVSWQAITKKSGHWYHQDKRDIIPQFVDGEGKTWGPRPANAQAIIDNGCEIPTTGIPDVDVVDATCDANGVASSSLTISAEGYKVLTLSHTPVSQTVDADGMGTYTFDNQGDIYVKIRIQVKDGIEYSGYSGWSYEAGSNPYIKYNTFQIKGADCEPELGIKKELTTSWTAEPGDEITFKVTVTNSGNASASGVSFTDTMDAPLGDLSWTMPTECAVNGGNITCGPFDVPANDSKVFTFTATVPPDGSVCSNGWVNNTASLNLDGQGEFQTTGHHGGDKPKTSDSAKVKIHCEPKIKIDKERTAGKYEVNPGDNITYTITVTNKGNTQLSGFVVTDQLDTTYLDFVSSEGCVESASVEGLVTCEVPVLEPHGTTGNSDTFTIIVQVHPDIDPQYCDAKFKNIASVGPSNTVQTRGGYDNPLTDTSDSVWNKVKKCDPKVSIEKSLIEPEDGIAEPGEQITFQVIVKNTGNGAATGVAFNDVMDAPLGDLTWTMDALCAEQTDGSIDCGPFDLVAQTGSKTFTFTATVPPDGSVCSDGWVYNTATLSSVDEKVEVLHKSGGGDKNDKLKTEGWAKVKIHCDPDIQIKKTGPEGATSFEAGPNEQYTYTITVSNTGNTTLSGYEVTDQLDTDYIRFVSATGCVETTAGSGSITCAVPELASQGSAGDSATFTITVEVRTDLELHQCDDKFYNKAFVGVASNQEFTTSTNHGGNETPSAASGKVWTKINGCDPDIEIAKSDGLDDDAFVLPADTITYTITVTNTGDINAAGYTMTDTLPSYLSFNFAGDPPTECSVSGKNLSCSVPTLAPTNSWEITVPVTVDSVPGGVKCEPVTNKAEVKILKNDNERSFSTQGGNHQSPSDSATETTKVACPKIVVSKKDIANEPVAPGTEFQYVITVENTGNVPLTDIEVEDFLPVGLEFVSWENVAGVTCEGRVCSFASLGTGESVTLTLNAKFITALTGGMCDGVWNGVFVDAMYGDNSVGSYADEKTVPDCDPDFSFDKSVTAGAGTIDPGESISYTITLTNEGNIDITEATITDALQALPGEATWTVTAPTGVDCTLTGLDLECLLTANLIPEASVEIVVSVNVPDELDITPNGNPWCGEWSNKAFVEGTYSSNQQPVPQLATSVNTQVPTVFEDNDDASAFVNCTGVKIEKEGTASVDPGGSIQYIITVTNMGNTTVNMDVTDELDARLSNVSATVETPAADVVCSVGADSTVTCPVNNLSNGQVATITITADVLPTPTMEQCEELILNSASIAPQMLPTLQSDNITIPQTYPLISNEVETSINCQPDLDLEKTGSVSDDGEISFTITASNTGTDTAEDQTIVDTLPEGLRGLDWDIALDPADTDAECGIANGVITCEPVTLDQYDGQLEITLTATTDDQNLVCGDYTNLVVMGELEADAMVSIECAQNYEVEKTSANTDDADEDGELSEGDTLTYTITVTNTGNQNLSGITLDDQFTGAGEGGLIWTAPTGFDGENVPDVAVGGSIDLVATYMITQADVDAGEIENCAFMTYQVDEETVIERDDCADDDIDQNPDVSLLKTGTVSGGADVLELGNTITYTFTVENTGDVTIENLSIDDPMEGVSFTDGNTIATLAPGESAELTAEYKVAQADVDSGMLVNCADVNGTAANGAEVMDDSCDTKMVDQERDLDALVLHECPGPAEELLAEGDFQVTYELTIVNNGTVSVHDVVITTSHEGDFSEPFPTTFEPGQSETRMWTITATEEEFESRIINVEVVVVGKTPNGTSAMMASMAAMQSVDDEVESRLVLTCPIDVPEEQKPAPAKAAVSNLPNTGSGNIASISATLWAAAMLSVVALGVTAVGVRRR